MKMYVMKIGKKSSFIHFDHVMRQTRCLITYILTYSRLKQKRNRDERLLIFRLYVYVDARSP